MRTMELDFTRKATALLKPKRERNCREIQKKAARFFAGLMVGLLVASSPATARQNGPRPKLQATTTTATITVQLLAAEDSTAVVQYAAILSDATTNAQLDSLFSGASNTVVFPNLTTVGVIQTESSVPTRYNLEQNYPNPFNPSTIIRFSVPGTDNVSLSIYDILGRKIATLVDQRLTAGTFQVTWSPNVASGVYFYRLQSGKFSETKKMIALDGSGHAAGGNSIAVVGAVSGGIHESLQPSLGKEQSGGGYVLRVYNVTGVTTPQVFYRLITIPQLSSDTTIMVYSPRVGEHVYPDNPQQIISGFGGANILEWRPDMTPAEVQTAYGSGPGQIGLTIMRLRVPFDSTKFSLNVPSAKLAESLGAKVFATPWTPPAWMKTSNNIVGGSLDTNNYAAFAAHLKSFADTMANNGAPLYAISVQNEPDFNATYEGCQWNGNQFLNFMKNYAPAVGIPVCMPESYHFNHSLSDPTLNDSVAASHVAFIGGHIYGTAPTSYPLAQSKGKEVWMTEYLINGTSGGVNLDTTMAGALALAKSINDCMNANMNAYVWWYTVRYYGPIDDGTTGGVAGTVTKKGYVMSQYARFVRPGYQRISADMSPQSNVYVTSYKKDSSVVIVALNLGPSTINQTFVIPHGVPTSYAAYVTSSTKNCELANVFDVSGITFTAVLDPSSVTTFVSN
jgi:glucuronoarabinoxylan endo-1,4-beta-xylanase